MPLGTRRARPPSTIGIAVPRFFLVLALGALLPILVAACAGEQATDSVSEDATPAPVEEVTWNTCTNPSAGYTIEYPQEWHTNSGDGLDPCRLFDPAPVSVPDESRDLPLDLGVAMRMAAIAFTDFTTADSAVEVQDERQVEVDGHMAIRQEVVATGQGLVPEGTESTRYAVDRNGETLVAESFAVGEPAYERKVEVLDEMMSSLEFTGEE